MNFDDRFFLRFDRFFSPLLDRKKKTMKSSFSLFLQKNKQDLLTFSCDEMDWCSLKNKGFSDLIFQETQVREVHEFFFIDKDDKGWWLGCHLGSVENLEAFPFVCRCWIDGNGIHNHIVQDS